MKKKKLEVSMVPIGGAASVSAILEPFKIKKGWRSLYLSVPDAQWLRDQLDEMLAREDCRHPRKVIIG